MKRSHMISPPPTDGAGWLMEMKAADRLRLATMPQGEAQRMVSLHLSEPLRDVTPADAGFGPGLTDDEDGALE